jgi:hypothetical protein
LAFAAPAMGDPAHAATPAAPSLVPRAGLTLDPKPFAFMAGRWMQEDAEGYSEEHWSDARGDTIMGVFRMQSPDGRTTMLELLSISQEAEGILLRLRHHSGDMVPWKSEASALELKYAADKSSLSCAVFESDGDRSGMLRGVEYRAAGADTLDIAVLFKQPPDKPAREDLRFSLKRHGASAPKPAAAGAIEEAKSLSREQARAAFERFKGLDGSWEGKSTKGWTDRVAYKSIAGGSCVMQTSFDSHPNEMMATMIHLDGERLLLTHYCMAKNQPRLVATGMSDDGTVVTFSFLDGTNLGPEGRNRGHMDKVVFTFESANSFTSRWTWYQDGKESWMEKIEHRRVPDRATIPGALRDLAP